MPMRTIGKLLVPLLAMSFHVLPVRDALCGALLDARSPEDVAKAFAPAGGEWKISETGYGGPAEGSWSYALGGDAAWSDYRVDCRVNLAQRASMTDGMEIGCFAYYHALANLGGYEAAIVVRHESGERHYRAAVSSLWKEIILWRPTGGVVQVQAYPFETGKSYDVSVACRGARIAVSVNGQEVIAWADSADPVLKGRVGVARKEGESYFPQVKVETLPPDEQKAPDHRPRFHELTWHNQRWFFDGKEPIFVVTGGNVLDNMKFIPGYRAAMYTFNYITDWNRFSPTRIVQSKVAESGDRLVLETTAEDPKTNSKIACATRLVVSYNPSAGMYEYDQDCAVDVGPEESEKVSQAWDHGDAVFLGGVGSADTRKPDAFRALYRWSVFQADDGRYYRIPFNHNGHYLGKSSTNGGPLKPDGGVWVVVGDPVLSPVVQIRGLAEGFSRVGCGHCWWAYDMHTMFYPKLVDNKVQPGRYVSKVRYTGMKAAEAEKLLEGAEFYMPADLSVNVPVYSAGLGFTERFDKEVLLASPHQEHRIWAGVIDRSVGRDDKCSLRLDGPTEAWTITGSSYFMAGYGKRNVVTVWVKTEDVRGDGPAIGFRRFDNSYGEFYSSGITGTNDWTKFSFVTNEPIDCWGVILYFRNAGAGTVWMDDFKIEALAEGQGTDVSAGRRYPLSPNDPDVVLRWQAEAGSGGVLDESGYGHHGKFYGQTAWVEEEDRKAIELDGKTAYVWPLSSPNLTLAPPYTAVFDLKLENGGHLLFWGWNCYYHITGNPPQFSVAYQLHGDKLTQSKPFLDAGKWQRLVIVAADGKVKLFCNGRFVEALPAQLRPGDWGLHNTSTWHRHLSFFGAGPGDMALTKDTAHSSLKGRSGPLVIYKRALSDEEIAGMGEWRPAPR